MSLATDIATYKATQKRVTVEASKILGGATGLLADTIPAACNHITLMPQKSGVYLNVGAAADSGDYLIPAEGVSFEGTGAYFSNIYLYSAARIAVDVLLGTSAMAPGADVGCATDGVASTLYDGGGTDNLLEVDATAAAVIACTSDTITVGAANLIRVFLLNSVAAQSCTFKVSQFSAATPTVATQTGQFERSVGTADHTSTVDRAAVELTTLTEYKAKDMIEFSVAPGTYLKLGLSADLGGGLWYCRYELRYE